MTIGGGTTAGGGAPVCRGGAGRTWVMGESGGRGAGGRVGKDGPAGMATGGAAVEGTGIGVLIGAAGA